MSSQDFSKKMIIVVRKDLPSWQVLNAVGHMAAYLGHHIKNDFDSGEYFVTKDGVNHPRNSQYPIVTLMAEKGDLYPLVQAAREHQLPQINFIQEMIDLADDAELAKRVGETNDQDLDYLGVGLFGDKEVLKTLTKNFKLWK